MDIGKYNDYMLAFNKGRNFTLNYPAKNITKYLYIDTKGTCNNITFDVYNNNSQPELANNITINCFYPRHFTISFEKNNNYYINISVNSNYNRMIRMGFYFLENDKDIIEIKDFNTDIKYVYTSYKYESFFNFTIKYFFINVENIASSGLIGYNIYDPFNSINYVYSLKLYNHYNISELPKSYEISDYDYETNWLTTLEEDPMILINKFSYMKGIILKIKTLFVKEDEVNLYNEMVIYLYPKKIFYIKENEKLNYTQLLTKNVFYLKDLNKNAIMKSNLNYFTLLQPSRKIIKAKSYLFNSSHYRNGIIFELPISENASIEFKLVNNSEIIFLTNPELMYLCNDNIEEEKYISLPYMTNFNILFGDLEIYEINVTSLKNLDEIYNDSYLENYNSLKRYNNYYSYKDEQYFYKLKCKNYSLLKYEYFIEPYINENATMNKYNKKLILDFSVFKQRKITFESNLSVYIGIINTEESNSNKNITLDISYNNEDYSLNIQKEIFFNEVKQNDILIIKKPDKNIYVYINAMYNYELQTIKPLEYQDSGIFIFERNISEEYDVLIYVSNFMNIIGKYTLLYGNPKNYEYNQLIYHKMEITNNPYKYIKEDDKTKYFFILYQTYPYEVSLNIDKSIKINLSLNKLIYINKYKMENLILKFPKINNEAK